MGCGIAVIGALLYCCGLAAVQQSDKILPDLTVTVSKSRLRQIGILGSLLQPGPPAAV
jgi:hypothetical protein